LQLNLKLNYIKFKKKKKKKNKKKKKKKKKKKFKMNEKIRTKSPFNNFTNDNNIRKLTLIVWRFSTILLN